MAPTYLPNYVIQWSIEHIPQSSGSQKVFQSQLTDVP